MRREEFLSKHPDLKPDMVAVSDDGERLGSITSLNEDSIDIGKGDFFPRDFAVRYDDIEDVHDGELVVSRTGDDLSSWKDPDFEGWSDIEELERGEEVDIILREEELEAHKNLRPGGQVRLRKVVHTEQKTFTIPVMREDVTVEHIEVSEDVEAGEGEQAFSEEEITIPVMEEEVEIVKRQRIKGRVHARKAAHIEQQEVSGSVRTEDVEVVREPAPGGGEERSRGEGSPDTEEEEEWEE
jgi:uncharacterized protein (TIGR02271 family)